MDYYKEIKNRLIDNEAYCRVKDYSKERNTIITYFEIGSLLYDAGKHYGEGIIKKYATSLEKEFGKKYDKRSLFRMRQFYLLFSDQKRVSLEGYNSKFLDNKANFNKKWVSSLPKEQKVVSPKCFSSNIVDFNVNLDKKVVSSDKSISIYPSFITELSWTHYRFILSISDENKRNYYINTSIVNHLSVRELRAKIKSNEYERLNGETKNKLIISESRSIDDYVPNPILIKNKRNVDVINEKILHNLIVEDISSFMKELGEGYSFIDSEYKIKIGQTYNYIDLLLFNIKYNCYVVVELKVTELKKEHIGQIEVYMNYIDENLRTPIQDKTIGIIICKQDNKYVIKYCSDSRIISREYKLI